MGRLSSVTARLSAAPRRLCPPPKLADPFYLSPEWRRFASDMKRHRGNCCEDCGRSGKERGVKLIADHVIERRDGGAEFDPMNIRIRCMPCHNAKTAKAKAERARGQR